MDLRLGRLELTPYLGHGGTRLITRGSEVQPALCQLLFRLSDRRVLAATLVKGDAYANAHGRGELLGYQAGNVMGALHASEQGHARIERAFRDLYI